MPRLVKFKSLFGTKKDKQEKAKRSTQVSRRCFDEGSKYASFIAMATAAQGADAEAFFPRILLQAAHHQTVVHLRAPISRGVLTDFISFLMYKGTKLSEINTLLGIECCQGPNTCPTITAQETAVEQGAIVRKSPPSEDRVDCSPESAPKAESATVSPCLLDFTVTKKLGAGSFGTVFLSRHKPSGVRVALKVIAKMPRGDDSGEDFGYSTGLLEERMKVPAGDETWGITESTLEEYFALHRLRGEERALQIHAAFHDLRYYYMATTYYPGGDLLDQLGVCRRLPIDRVRFYTADLLLGLEALRRHGIVHRDLKPSNVLIGTDGHLVIADFGLARGFERYMGDIEKAFLPPSEVEPTMEDSRELTHRMCGTADYVAPEIYRKEGYSYAADVWSVGVIVYRMLVGRVPWEPLIDKHGGNVANVIVKEKVVVAEWERVLFNLDAQAECFFLAALDKDQHTRPTPPQLRTHALFGDFDWERHTRCEAPACWAPGARSNRVPSPEVKRPFINGTRVYTPAEDPFPRFTFLSPLLSPDISTVSATLSNRSPSSSSVPPPSIPSSVPEVPPPSSAPSPTLQGPLPLSLNLEVPVFLPSTASGLSSPVSTVGSVTLVGSPVPPHCYEGSSATAKSGPRSIPKLKEWVRGILRAWRSPTRQ